MHPAVYLLFAPLGVYLALFDYSWWLPTLWPWAAHPLASTSLKSCKFLDRGVFGCESIAVVGDRAYLACSHKSSRLRWYPPLLHLSPLPVERDSLYVYDFATGTLSLLTIDNPPAEAVWHGLDAKGRVLAIVNLRRTGPCIEILEHTDPAVPRLVHRDSVCSSVLNGVSGVSLRSPNRHDFVASVLADFSSMNAIASAAVAQTGKLVGYVQGKPAAVILDGIAHATDVAFDASGELLFVAHGFHGKVVSFKVTSGLSLRGPPASIALPHATIRLSMSSSGVLLATGPLRAVDLTAWRLSAYKHRAGSAVSRILNNTDDSRFYGKQFMSRPSIVDSVGMKLNMATVAAAHENTVLVGGPMMQGVLACHVGSTDA